MGESIALMFDFKGMQARKAAAKAEQQQIEVDRQLSDISQRQDTVDRTKQLYAQLASVNNSFASSGLTGAGATKMNLARGEKKMSSSDIASRKVMGSSQRRKLSLQGFDSKMRGKAAGYEFGRKVGKFASGSMASKKAGGSYLI